MKNLDTLTAVPYERPRYSSSRTLRRLFSGSGTPVDMRNLAHAIPACASALNRSLFGRRPELPFIPYAATAVLAKLLSGNQTVVEIGAGMSTLWLAVRARTVVTYEWDADWHRRLGQELHARRLRNVDLRYCVGHEPVTFTDIDPGTVDLAIIDGGPRSLCLHNLWPKVRWGGWIYLDNWDSDTFWLEGGHNARRFLRARRPDLAACRRFVDYVPGYLNVNEGLLLQKRSLASTEEAS